MKKRRRVIKVVALLTALGISVNGFYNYNQRMKYKDKLILGRNFYYDEINRYNNFLEEYTQYVKSLGLNDLEIIIKIMKDQWLDIEGYAKVDNLRNPYFRLTLQEEGKGVCTSFADDFTARINAINPKYNARILVVYMNNINENVKSVNIERKVLSSSTNSNSINFLKKIYGNHMVSVVEIPEQNITLIVDPTNLLIGQLKNGQINMLNIDDNFMDIRYNTSTHYTTKSYLEIVGDYFDTYKKSKLNEDKIVEFYGIEAQEAAFDKIEKIDEAQKRKVFLR